MNKTTFFKSWLLLLCMIVGSSAAWAEEVTYKVASKTSVTTSGTAPEGSSVSYSQTYSTAGQLTNGNTATLTVTNLPSNITITGIKLGVHNNKTAGNGNASATMGGVEFATLSEIKGLGNSAFVDKDMEVTPTTPSGNLVITIEATENSVYIETFKIIYTVSGSSLQNSDFALSGSNNNLSFDLYNNKASQTISYTTSSTGTVSVSENEYVDAVVDETAKKITITPKKKTNGEVEITVKQAKDDAYAAGSFTFTVNISDSTPKTGSWVKTSITDLTSEDFFVIVCAKSSKFFALSNDGAAATAPTAVAVVVENDEITSKVENNIIWKIGNTNDGYVFYPNEDTENWLYCTNTNNGVRVGINDNKYFSINSGYLYNKGTSRYVGVYNNRDWRCYTSTSTNISGQTFAFYKYTDGSTTPDLVATRVTIDASGITNTDVYTATTAGQLTATVEGVDGSPISGATVTWTSSKEGVATINANGVVTLVAAGTTTITASYAGVEGQYRASTATYELNVTNSDPNVPGTENKPYTVAEARAAIDAGTGVTGVYATGIVSEIVTAYNSQFGNITYNISADGTTTADQLQSYRGKSYNGNDFTSENDIQVGDVVVIYGNLKKYNSTYEFEQDNQLVSLDRPVVTTPTLDVTPANVSLPYTGGSGDFTVTPNNVNGVFGGYVTFYDPTNTETTTDEPSWINISYDSSNLTLSYSVTDENQTGADRTACFKYFIMCDNGGAVSNLITVTQQTYVAPTVATLPFEFNNGKADIEDTDGLTQEGVGSDYSASPKLKFDTTGDWLLLHFDERPGILTFNIKNNSFSGGTFTVQTSEDGVTYTDLEAYTTITGTQNEEFDNLNENVRYIKWIYTEKVSGNVGLGNIKLAKYAAPTPSITIAATDAQVNVDAAGGDGNISFTYENLAVTDNNDFDVVFFDADDNEINQPGWIQAEVNAIDNIYYVVDANTDAAARTAYLKVYAIDDENNDVYSNVVTITQEGVPPVVTKEYFVKVTNTSDLTDGQYLIVNEENGIAFDGSLTTLDAVGNNKEVVVSENIALAETSLIFTYDANAKTLKSASGYYIGQTSDANGLASDKTTTYENAISFDDKGNANIVSGSAYLRYNAASNADRFRYYKSSSYTNQKPVQLYKLTTTTPTVAVTITDAGYATYCSAYNLDFSNVSGLTAYEATIDGTTVAFDEGDKIFAAGEGILLKGSESTYTIPVIASATANTNNKLVGVLAEEEVAAGIYVLLNTNNNPGFYKTKSAFTVGAHTAYLPAQAGGNGAREFIAIDDNTTTGVNSMDNGQWTIDNVYNLNGQRVNNAKKGLYIVNGKKVVIK